MSVPMPISWNPSRPPAPRPRGVAGKDAGGHRRLAAGVAHDADRLQHAGIVDLARDAEAGRQVVGPHQHGADPFDPDDRFDVAHGVDVLGLQDDAQLVVGPGQVLVELAAPGVGPAGADAAPPRGRIAAARHGVDRLGRGAHLRHDHALAAGLEGALDEVVAVLGHADQARARGAEGLQHPLAGLLARGRVLGVEPGPVEPGSGHDLGDVGRRQTHHRADESLACAKPSFYPMKCHAREDSGAAGELSSGPGWPRASRGAML